MTAARADLVLLGDWIAGRSIARGLPPPVADRGGWRVDTGTAEEDRRWLFATPGPGLIALGRSIRDPRSPLKLLGTADELMALLPAGWHAAPPAAFMAARGDWPHRPLPEGYAATVETAGARTAVRIADRDGTTAASGYAAETARAFVYDRIVVDPAHRRRGLGHALMTLLRGGLRDADTPQLLVATAEGRLLYERLGWIMLSPYATAIRRGDG